jgi:arylsulfatase A-like enzyme
MKEQDNSKAGAADTVTAVDRRNLLFGSSALAAASALASLPGDAAAQAQQQNAASGELPNIVFIMGDDIGWFNIGAYHRGMMAGRTPNIDRLAAEGMMFTDYYAEASCTAGRVPQVRSRTD